MPAATMRRLLDSSSSGGGGGGGREVEASAAAAVLCAPRPRRAHVQPCIADVILGPTPFFLSSVGAAAANGGSSSKCREGKKTAREGGLEVEEEEGVGWALLGGSPPARAGNPLVNDPHFLLIQRRPAPASDLPIFDHHHHGRGSRGHLPTAFSDSNSSSSFAPSCAPAVRIQGFDVASCRSSHGGSSGGGGRVLSARA